MVTLEAGNKAPLFTLKNESGESVALKDLKGQKVVLYFYPADDTPGCTKQACNIKDNYKELKKHKISIFGISPDDEESHTKFIKKYKLPFSLLSDPKHQAIEKYGVWGEKNMYGRKFMGMKRTTFLLDEEGNIYKVIKGVKTAEHTAQVLKGYGIEESAF
jgi:thioredoxin-dependent peroxiredoxin